MEPMNEPTPEPTSPSPAEKQLQVRINILIGLVVLSIITVMLLAVGLILTDRRIDTIEKRATGTRGESAKVTRLAEQVKKINSKLKALDNQVQDNETAAKFNDERVGNLNDQVKGLSDTVEENEKTAEKNNEEVVEELNDLIDSYNEHLSKFHD